MSGKLYVVGTPIGNLSDFSPRAVQALQDCDFIAAEDTRVTLKLLNHFEIKKPMISYFEHNKREKGEQILQKILQGECCALVTDAGMPAISDPGEDLVDLCLNNGVTVESVPGPTAFATAVAVSGLPSGRFCFEGFLSVNKPSRREHLNEIRDEKRTLVFYEAPHKLVATLHDLYDCLGDRRVAIIKELTKLHETVERTTLGAACERYDGTAPKGEYVLVIEGKPQTQETVLSLEDAVAIAKRLRDSGIKINEAAKTAAKESGLKKNDIYKLLLEDEK
ncbi:MAG: 16S rRNA (cytidine(1402)-2'-O)-methyltransferase [Clostridia bacterium]|nr:16S rRNA (cytidine(1402)-2'-O)-methyltransferase [Clostridia bacterium]